MRGTAFLGSINASWSCDGSYIAKEAGFASQTDPRQRRWPCAGAWMDQRPAMAGRWRASPLVPSRRIKAHARLRQGAGVNCAPCDGSVATARTHAIPANAKPPRVEDLGPRKGGVEGRRLLDRAAPASSTAARDGRVGRALAVVRPAGGTIDRPAVLNVPRWGGMVWRDRPDDGGRTVTVRLLRS